MAGTTGNNVQQRIAGGTSGFDGVPRTAPAVPARRRAVPLAGPGCAVVTAAFLVAAAASAARAAPLTERVSLGPSGQQGNGDSRGPAITAQGRYVAFDSLATNFTVPPLETVAQQVYRRERKTGATTLVSVGHDGAEGDGPSSDPAMSRGGRFVAFSSNAGNLVPGVGQMGTQVYMRDVVEGVTVLVSANARGRPANLTASSAAVSADGSLVAFISDATNLVPGGGAGGANNLYVRDTRTGALTLADVGIDGRPGAGSYGISGPPAMTADGRWLAFVSDAGNLVAGDTNDSFDVFLRDRQTGRTVLVSTTPAGGPSAGGGYYDATAISDDGRLVAFASNARDLVPGDTNGRHDVFVRDVRAGRTERISIGTGGAQMTDDSRWMAMSADGRLVAFQSDATNLVPGDTNGRADIFVRDRVAGATVRASVAADGAQARNGGTGVPAISADGRFVTFQSATADLVPRDTNRLLDIFVRRLAPAAP